MATIAATGHLLWHRADSQVIRIVAGLEPNALSAAVQ
jgi:hypothetical protein